MLHLPDLRGFKMKQNSTGVIKIHDISIYSRRIYARVRTGGASASSRTRICFCTCFINCGIWKVSATSNIHARSKVFWEWAIPLSYWYRRGLTDWKRRSMINNIHLHVHVLWPPPHPIFLQSSVNLSFKFGILKVVHFYVKFFYYTV